MLYVIQRNDGKFVTPPGGNKSYTEYLQHARTFNTAAAAQRECCENETVRSLDECVKQPTK